MTAIELRSSINSDLSVLGIEALEHVSRYVHRLSMHTRVVPATPVLPSPRKVKITNRIRRMSGRFSVPVDADYKQLKADILEERYF